MKRHPREPTAPLSFRQADPSLSEGGERVAKALARAGVASRREVERLIAEGRVALNGRLLDTPAVKIAPDDMLTVDGQPVAAAEATRVWRYHKPAGLLTTHSDPKGRPTVFERLPPGLPRVISVGRLDLNTEGLLLLTNDGALARALELPSSGWVRQYRARAFGRIDQAALDRLKQGITVEGVAYGPIEARLDKVQHRSSTEPGGKDLHGPANVWITLSLTEGKNREVRRVLEALGLKVNRLLRLAYGPFALGTLALGAAEEVGPRVIREQLSGFVAEENLPKGDRVRSSAPATRTEAPPPSRGRGRGEGGRAPTPQGRRAGSPASAETELGGAKPSRTRAPSARPLSDGRGEGEKKVYKPGWAKPKPRARPSAKPGAPGKRPRG